MGAPEQLRQAMDDQLRRLRATIPTAREAALLSVLRALDALPQSPADPVPDVITGHRRPALGASVALKLCLESTGEAIADAADLAAWAEAFLADCADLAAAELVLTHGETGFMRLVENESGGIDAWIATKVVPPAWRERADIDWWATWSAGRGEAELATLRTESPAEDWYAREARVHLERMAYQLGYPPEAMLGGIAVRTWRDVVRVLIAVALEARDHGETPVVRTERELTALLASQAGLSPQSAAPALSALAVDPRSAGWHGTVRGGALAPLVRIDDDLLALSVHSLLTEPFFFLCAELRRRDPEAYHNAASAREDAFRRDLSDLFGDRRFVTATSRIVLRRKDGKARTDIDAAVFDRKTGALGLFELKWQDPFVLSGAELARQRANLLNANRQVSGILDWVNRHGGHEILCRLDRPASKRFRVRKVYPFVLGRYLAHFPDGPAPDRRAAWSSWPQVLRVPQEHPIGAKAANPIASLFSRLSGDTPPLRLPADLPPRKIRLGETVLTVWPSYAAYREESP